MCNVPLNFYTNDDPSLQPSIKGTVIQWPDITIEKDTSTENQITAVYFYDSNGRWVPPVELYAFGKAKRKYDYPYILAPGSSSSSIILDNKSTLQTYGSTNANVSFLNIAISNGKMGIQLWSGNTLVFKWTNFSEAYVTKECKATFDLYESTTNFRNCLNKTMPLRSYIQY